MGDLEGHLFPCGDDRHGLALDQVRLPAPGIQFYPRTQRQCRDLVQSLRLQFGRDIHQLRHTHQVLARHQPVTQLSPQQARRVLRLIRQRFQKQSRVAQLVLVR